MKNYSEKNLWLCSKNRFLFKIYSLLLKLGIKNPGNIYSGLKHCCWKWFFDGFFSGNYVYISNERYIMAKEFKSYFNDKNKYEKLIKDLDFESIHLINRYFNVINTVLGNRDLCLPRELLCISDNSRKITKNVKEYVKGIYMPTNLLAEVGFYKHGINHIPNIIDYTKGKDVIDCGAYIGDSAMMFNKELEVNKIFCCEPDPQNYKILNKVIQKNCKEKYIYPINFGVGSKKCELHFDAGKGVGSGINNEGKITIKIDTIDNLVKENNINPGLIKRDIEGAEYDSILGAEQTIKKYKPDLLISIYHTAKDFFEIKPLLGSWNLGYNFKIVHCSADKTSNADIMLLAYIV